MRYWKHNGDGSYVICLDSTFHQDCPLVPGHVRGEFHGAYLISPPKEDEYDEDQLECLLTFICQMDPKGWIWKSFGYQHLLLEQVRNSLTIQINNFLVLQLTKRSFIWFCSFSYMYLMFVTQSTPTDLCRCVWSFFFYFLFFISNYSNGSKWWLNLGPIRSCCRATRNC